MVLSCVVVFSFMRQSTIFPHTLCEQLLQVCFRFGLSVCDSVQVFQVFLGNALVNPESKGQSQLQLNSISINMF